MCDGRGLMQRNSTLCKWLMMGHLSNAISCQLCVLLVYCKCMGTTGGGGATPRLWTPTTPPN